MNRQRQPRRGHRGAGISPGRPSPGFSLLELLVVLAISAMLLLLATDGYAAARARAARHEVRIALWRLAAAQETHRLNHGFYATQLAATPGTATSPLELAPPSLPPAGWRFELLGVGDESWEMRATATNTKPDPDCAVLGLDTTGLGTAQSVDGRDTSANCWRH